MALLFWKDEQPWRGLCSQSALILFLCWLFALSALSFFRNKYAFRSEPSTDVQVQLRPRKIGIFVDFEKGQVQFSKLFFFYVLTLTSNICKVKVLSHHVCSSGLLSYSAVLCFCRFPSTMLTLKSTSTPSTTFSASASTHSSAPALINLERTKGHWS